MLIFVSVGVLGFIIMIFLSENLFFDGLIGNIEFSASKDIVKKKLVIENLTRQTKPYLALARKEITMLFKTPIYLLNSIGGVIVIPVVLVMTIVTGKKESLDIMAELIKIRPELIALVGIGYITFLGMLNSIGVTTFSREGKNFWIQRILPIKARDQIIGRILSLL